MRALITGATGFIGSRLIQELINPVILTRDPEKAKKKLGDFQFFKWLPDQGLPPLEAFQGIDVIFHLAGEPIVKGRWTAARKKRIFDSRVIGTRNLVSAIKKLARKPIVLVSASAVGYYGSRGEEILDEADAPGNDFLAQLCEAWEAEALGAEALGVRVIIPRFGMVLEEGGGALQKMLPLFRLGLGGKLGDGKQWMSWIHRDDLVGILLHLVNRAEMKGPVNAVTAAPVRNEEFTQILAKTLKKKVFLPVPTFLLKILFGEKARALLSSQRVLPRVVARSGYEFLYPKLDEALETILKPADKTKKPMSKK